MRKQILVIGGTYFAGRVFSILTSRGDSGRDDLDLHVVNRGRFPLNNLQHVTQYVCDRHESEKLVSMLPDGLVFDAVVDFCAYEPGEIRALTDALAGRFRQYIYLSTCTVYAPASGCLSETAPVIENFGSSPEFEYAGKKYALEQELIAACQNAGAAYTILRPAFIYGPFNYAPRESFYAKLIAAGQPVPVPTDASGRFSFVYVYDVSAIINRCIGNEKAFDCVFNLAAPEIVDYTSFLDTFRQCYGSDFPTYPVTVRQVIEQNIPLPFPLDEDQLYSGKRAEELLDFSYTPFATGMKKTVELLKDLYPKK